MYFIDYWKCVRASYFMGSIHCWGFTRAALGALEVKKAISSHLMATVSLLVSIWINNKAAEGTEVWCCGCSSQPGKNLNLEKTNGITGHFLRELD